MAVDGPRLCPHHRPDVPASVPAGRQLCTYRRRRYALRPAVLESAAWLDETVALMMQPGGFLFCRNP